MILSIDASVISKQPLDEYPRCFLLFANKFAVSYFRCKNLFLFRQRPFWLKRIPHSNLLLVVISNQFAEKLSLQIPTTKEVHYLQDYPCYKKLQNTTGRYERPFTSSPLVRHLLFVYSAFLQLIYK